MGICEDSETLGEDLWGFTRIHETLERGFMGIHMQSCRFTRLWERICKDFQDFWRGFARVCGDS